MKLEEKIQIIIKLFERESYFQLLKDVKYKGIEDDSNHSLSNWKRGENNKVHIAQKAIEKIYNSLLASDQPDSNTY